MSKPVLFHERQFYCFSNFSSFKVFVFSEHWMTAEHAYQASKFVDFVPRMHIRRTSSAYDAKKCMRSYQDKVREDWPQVKLLLMETICRAKLQQHSFIQECLLETGDRDIIEDSLNDSFWGWGPDQKGFNHLGKIWMKLRDEM